MRCTTVPAVKYLGYRVYTNNAPCGAMRGTAPSMRDTRSSRCSTSWPASSASIPSRCGARIAHAAVPDDQRPSGKLLRTPHLPRLGRAARLEDAARTSAARARSRACLLALLSRVPRNRCTGAESHMHESTSSSTSTAGSPCHRAFRHRSGLVDAARAGRCRGAGASARADSRHRDRQRAYPEGQRLVFLAGVVHGGQRRAVRRTGNEARARPRGGEATGSRCGRYRVGRRALPSSRHRSYARLRGRGRGGALAQVR